MINHKFLRRQFEEAAGGNAAFPRHRGTRKKREAKKKEKKPGRLGREKEAEVPPRNKAAIHVWRLVINVSCYKMPPLRPLDAIAQTPGHRRLSLSLGRKADKARLLSNAVCRVAPRTLNPKRSCKPYNS